MISLDRTLGYLSTGARANVVLLTYLLTDSIRIARIKMGVDSQEISQHTYAGCTSVNVLLLTYLQA